MAQWIYFIHAPRDDFAATITEEEAEVWQQHFAHLQQLLNDGVLILAGPTLGSTNTGIAIFEAPDQEAAQAIMHSDPTISSGLARGELRPFRVSLLRS